VWISRGAERRRKSAEMSLRGTNEGGRLLHTLDDFKPAGVCRTLWSFAQLGIHPEDGLIERLMNRTM